MRRKTGQRQQSERELTIRAVPPADLDKLAELLIRLAETRRSAGSCRSEGARLDRAPSWPPRERRRRM